MGRYSTTQQETSKRSREPHEIWKNLGCIIMLIMPVISVAAAYETVNWILTLEGPRLIPHQLLGIPRPPDFFYKSGGLLTIFKFVTGYENFYAIAIASFFYLLLIGGVISVIYAAVYTAVAPSRYGPTDAPPPKIKVVKKSR